jgi:hypothetical protein
MIKPAPGAHGPITPQALRGFHTSVMPRATPDLCHGSLATMTLGEFKVMHF